MQKQQFEQDPQLVRVYEQKFAGIKDKNAKLLIKAIRGDKHQYYEYSQPYTITKMLYKAFEALSGYDISQCKKIDDLLNPKIVEALTLYVGEEEMVRLRLAAELVLARPYSQYSYFRPSYRSTHVVLYTDSIFSYMTLAFYNYHFTETLVERLKKDANVQMIDVAIALRERDPEVVDLIEEAIMGDNSEVTLTQTMIYGIMIAGCEQELELLGKLLLAAKRQEGIRQSILEACDMGATGSHRYFIKLILENDLCRFSSVMRAFGTWSGLAYPDVKQRVVEKHMHLAAKYLKPDADFEAGLASEDVVEIYMALWAQGCDEIEHAFTSVARLLQSPKKYKRLVGWYFIKHTNDPADAHQIALKYLHVREKEELAWICSCLGSGAFGRRHGHDKHLYKGDEAKSKFFEIAEVVEFIGKKSTKFAESVFPWVTQTLTTENLGQVLIGIVKAHKSEEMIDKLADVAPLIGSAARETYYKDLLKLNSQKQRQDLFTGLGDRSQYTREAVVKRLGELTLDNDEILLLTKKLTSKSATMRKAIMTVLDKQAGEQVEVAIDSLLGVKNKEQLLAGAELLELNENLQAKYADNVAVILENDKLAGDVRASFEKVLPVAAGTRIDYTAENGWGLFDPDMEVFDLDKARDNRPEVPIYSDGLLKKDLQKLALPDVDELKRACQSLNEVYRDNLNYEYEVENWDGGKEKVLLGGGSYHPGDIRLLSYKSGGSKEIYNYPLAEKWIHALGDFATDRQKLVIAVKYLNDMNNYYSSNKREILPWLRNIFKGYPLDAKVGGFEQITGKKEKNGIWPYAIRNIFEAMNQTFKDDDVFDFILGIYVNLVNRIPEKKLSEICVKDSKQPYNDYHYHYYKEIGHKPLGLRYFSNWRTYLMSSEDNFEKYFNEMWYQFVASGCEVFYGLGILDIFKAHKLGYLPDEFLYYYFIAADDAANRMRNLTNTRVYQYQSVNADYFASAKADYPHVIPFLEKAIDRIVEVEVKRGELETPLTAIAGSIMKYHGGIKHFVRLLVALGETNFSRGYSYWSGGRYTKQQTLSGLLKACHPLEGDTAEALRVALKEAKIAEKRIIQAAIYAPHWARMLEEAMGITGLRSGVWFFHAHANELFSAEKETEVALYSSITPQQFMDGIFDRDWFLELYDVIGEKRFKVLHGNAKYISGSTIHRRAQMYSDAVLGKFDAAELQAEISDKRNQEKLRAYALIPVGKKEDAVDRYEFIQQFSKESRKFGAQRRASEKKAVGVALENLAIATGFGDVDRMTWVLEGEKVRQLAPLMEARVVGEYQVWMEISADGTPSLKVQKGEKVLKSVPKAIAKDEHALVVKEAVKSLKDQKKRGKESFENAMVARSEFEASEVVSLLEHPVLADMVGKLVFVSGDLLGFVEVRAGKLVLLGVDGAALKIGARKKLRIAHPYDLLAAGVWSEFQRYVFAEKIVQPFKQVFREFYPVTEDELAAGTVSRRYAGHQVQASKTVALLKTRGWTVDYESGLQRVYHKENLVVRMYAMADWFTPADIEPPTLETVEFYRRDKWESVAFSDVDPVIFSEVMRDIDLVVSVAHAGGVDPEASHSTVEMRVAMARELLSLLKVGNVEFQSAHAEIEGSLGKYSVHMGSGVAHVLGRGMVSILPVHSQRRGKIFLPFADEDPRTAEVLSKILLLADDGKIKDPSILSQIKG